MHKTLSGLGRNEDEVRLKMIAAKEEFKKAMLGLLNQKSEY